MSDNVLYYGDNLEILRRYIEKELVDPIYLDPPEDTPFTYDYGDLMTQAGDTDLCWDKNGSLKPKDETEDTTLVYNWDNKLRSATKGAESMSVKYDPMGNREHNSSRAQSTRRNFI